MTFGYFAPAPAMMPVGLPAFGKKRPGKSKAGDKAASKAKASK